MKTMSASTNHEARLKMDMAIFEHGRRKAELTLLIKGLEKLDDKGPTIEATIEILKKRKRELGKHFTV